MTSPKDPERFLKIVAILEHRPQAFSFAEEKR